MNKRQVERYFTVLGKLYPKRCSIILTGAAAGVLYGRVRATMDMDFAARTSDWESFAKAVREIGQRTGIAAQFAEDIDRWSSVSLLDYAGHTYVYKRFGLLEVRLMDPPYWAIGKLSRYLDTDIQDLVKVFKKTRTPWQDVALVAGRALRRSPKSTALFLFRRQAEDFFKRNGRKIWGRGFEADEALDLFHQRAGIR